MTGFEVNIGLETISFIVIAGLFLVLWSVISSVVLMKQRNEKVVEEMDEMDEDLYVEENQSGLNEMPYQEPGEDGEERERTKNKFGFGSLLLGKKNKFEKEGESERDEVDEDEDEILDDDEDENENMFDDFERKMEDRQRERDKARQEQLAMENERKSKLREELGKLKINKYSNESEIELPTPKRRIGEGDEEDEILNRLNANMRNRKN